MYANKNALRKKERQGLSIYIWNMFPIAGLLEETRWRRKEETE
jgi:hypothetical protein